MMEPIQLQAPKEPFQVEAAIKLVEAKPLEIMPLQLQLPNQELHVTTAGIPEKIKVEWDLKALPLNVHWPEEPVKVNFAFDTSTSRAVQVEIEKRVADLQNNLKEELTKQLYDSNKRVVKALKQEVNGKMLPPEKEQAKTGAVRIFTYILLSGICGGFCGALWRFLRRKTAAERSRSSLDERNDPQTAENFLKALLKAFEQFVISFVTAYPEWGRGIIFGVFAALMFPAVSSFFGKPDLRRAADDPYTLVRLCSFCFIVAMVGEVFVEWSLDRLSRFLRERRFRSLE